MVFAKGDGGFYQQSVRNLTIRIEQLQTENKKLLEYIVNSECDSEIGNTSVGPTTIHSDNCRRCEILKVKDV